jgi:general secretion pathway protein H
MTLIEITISLLIVGLLVFIAVPSVESIAGVHAREEAGRIAGAVRYMYGQSALTGKACRLVFDMDERAWWPECTQDRFTVASEKERSHDGRMMEERKTPEFVARFAGELLDEAQALQQKVEKEAEFSAFSSEEMKRRTIPDGADVSVWVAHQTERYTSGKAYLYFFPQGNTERAQIYVSHGKDVYTLVVSPLNGRVRVVDEELDVPRS